MAQSLVKIYVHVVYSTKHRQPWILPHIETELYGYLGWTYKEMGCPVIQVGGYMDHVHILCQLSKVKSIAKVQEISKSRVSKWIKTKGLEFENFDWQDGYGAFSVNPTQIDDVSNYIANQHIHHSQIGFQDEFRGFLKKYKFHYDERYVWD